MQNYAAQLIAVCCYFFFFRFLFSPRRSFRFATVKLILIEKYIFQPHRFAKCFYRQLVILVMWLDFHFEVCHIIVSFSAVLFFFCFCCCKMHPFTFDPFGNEIHGVWTMVIDTVSVDKLVNSCLYAFLLTPDQFDLDQNNNNNNSAKVQF